MSHKEFIDKDRPVEADYYQLMDQADSMEVEDFIKALEGLMKEDPYFLDTHLFMVEILNENDEPKKARKLLNEIYDRAIELITDEEGNWPEKLPWGFMENRHIIRTLFNKAVVLWDQKKTNEALDLLRKLLKTNPNDNIGARHYVLAIRLGMSFRKFENRFDRGGYYDSEVNTWFDQNSRKFPEEFGWWFDLMDKQNESGEW
ncbi:MAG: hypothetical protein WEA36_06000 [Balneolaceae bacterium]